MIVVEHPKQQLSHSHRPLDLGQGVQQSAKYPTPAMRRSHPDGLDVTCRWSRQLAN
jgi:hypothetical protein